MNAKRALKHSFWYLLVISIILTFIYFDEGTGLSVSKQNTAWFCSGIVFVVYMLIRRSRSLSVANFPRLASIASSDYTFSKYLTINITSLLYAVSQGVAVGFFAQQVAALIDAIVSSGNLGNLVGDYYFIMQFLLLIAPLAALLILRVVLEGYIILFSAAQKIQNFVDHSVVEQE